jgi:hypothetical protein
MLDNLFNGPTLNRDFTIRYAVTEHGMRFMHEQGNANEYACFPPGALYQFAQEVADESARTARQALYEIRTSGHNYGNFAIWAQKMAAWGMEPNKWPKPEPIKRGVGKVFDGGGWYYKTELRSPLATRYFVESGESGPDVRLYINGNFGDDDDRRKYGERLAAFLNGDLDAP